ncbi:MAG: DUF4232 domain-containing protein [Candidatus Levyibacteriota bacterium]
MLRILFGILLLILLIAGGVYIYQQKHLAVAPGRSTAIPTPTKQPTPTITPLPTVTLDSYCTSANVTGTISLDGAAGNIFGTLTLKNISTKACAINANNFIQATSTAKNITITQEGKIGLKYINLQPNQTIYSQVHYPNGPQCNGTTKAQTITFAYQISPSQTVTFEDKNNNLDQALTACAADDEKTAIEVWSISSSPSH